MLHLITIESSYILCSAVRRISRCRAIFHAIRHLTNSEKIYFIEKSTDKVDAFFLAGMLRLERLYLLCLANSNCTGGTVCCRLSTVLRYAPCIVPRTRSRPHTFTLRVPFVALDLLNLMPFDALLMLLKTLLYL